MCPTLSLSLLLSLFLTLPNYLCAPTGHSSQDDLFHPLHSSSVFYTFCVGCVAVCCRRYSLKRPVRSGVVGRARARHFGKTILFPLFSVSPLHLLALYLLKSQTQIQSSLEHAWIPRLAEQCISSPGTTASGWLAAFPL